MMTPSEGRMPIVWALVMAALLSACGALSANTKVVDFSKLSPRVARDVTRVMLADSHKFHGAPIRSVQLFGAEIEGVPIS
jgi:hypothetical protein